MRKEEITDAINYPSTRVGENLPAAAAALHRFAKIDQNLPVMAEAGTSNTHKNSLSSPFMDEILYLQCFGIENQHLSWPKSFSKLKCQFREILEILQGHLLCSLVWSVGERIVRMALELLLLGLDHVF